MVDHRYFRTARASDSDPSGNFLGPQQMQWLERQLLDWRGPFVILSCGTMGSDTVSNGKDSCGKYDPKQTMGTMNPAMKIHGGLLPLVDRSPTG